MTTMTNGLNAIEQNDLTRYRIARHDISVIYVHAMPDGRCYEASPRSMLPVERDGWRTLGEIRDNGFEVTPDGRR